MKPLLFLDVDGVINCINFDAEYEQVKHPDDFMIATVPQGTKERLAEALPHFEVVWATAWMGRAHTFFREHLGLPDESWPHISFTGLKLPEIIKYAAGRPWAWIDDDALWELNQLHPAFKEIPNTLILVPSARFGITDKHVEQLLAFSNSCN